MSEAACIVRDRAGPMFDADSLELGKCNSIEFNLPLNEFERQSEGLSHRFETWPAAVRARHQREIEKWTADHPKAVIRLVSFGLHQGVTLVILHYAEK